MTECTQSSFGFADSGEREIVALLESHQHPPKEIVLDLDATDLPLHGKQEDRFFQGDYDGYCYLPLYILSVSDHRKPDYNRSRSSKKRA